MTLRRPTDPHLLIAGVGNILLSDDGLGVEAARRLGEDPIPGVAVVEIGTAILHGLSFLETAQRVLVIDAAKGGKPPGTIYLFEATEGAAGQAGAVSLHALGLCEAAKVLLGRPVPPITVIGVEPQALGYGMELSAPVRAALPRVVALARNTVLAWLVAGRDQKAGGLEPPVAGGTCLTLMTGQRL